jgi:hypothetical protein
MPYTQDLKALHILRQNVRVLLLKRRESEALLSAALGFKHRSSLNKFLNNDRAGFQLWRLDRLAAFFGLPVYQLFQPGISPLTERRRSGERRCGQDRRISHAQRQLRAVATELESVRPQRKDAPHEVDPAQRAAAALQVLNARYLEDVNRVLATADLGGQTPTTRPRVAKARQSRRAVGGSDPPKS